MKNVGSPPALTPPVRRAIPSDATNVVDLIAAYAQEVYSQIASVTPESLLRDGFGSVLEFVVSEQAGELRAFAAWEKTYDIVTGSRGGVVLAIYVRPDTRGGGLGDALLAAVAREVRAIGGTFLAGIAERPVELSEAAPPSCRWLAAHPPSGRLGSSDFARSPEATIHGSVGQRTR